VARPKGSTQRRQDAKRASERGCPGEDRAPLRPPGPAFARPEDKLRAFGVRFPIEGPHAKREMTSPGPLAPTPSRNRAKDPMSSGTRAEDEPQRRRDTEEGLVSLPPRLCASVFHKTNEGPHAQRRRPGWNLAERRSPVRGPRRNRGKNPMPSGNCPCRDPSSATRGAHMGAPLHRRRNVWATFLRPPTCLRRSEAASASRRQERASRRRVDPMSSGTRRWTQVIQTLSAAESQNNPGSSPGQALMQSQLPRLPGN
jgi:hypothetical protein